jgi:hypothetical protein
MDFESIAEQILAEEEEEKKRAWRKSPKYLAIKKITRADLENGSDYIEKLDSPPWNKKSDSNPGKLVGFGKYKHLTYEELKEQQPGYYNWACSEIKGFKEKAMKNL